MEPADGSRTRLERDLFLSLLELGHHQDVGPFLQAALRAIAAATGATQGYIELQDGDGDRWSMTHGLDADELGGVRAAISSGVIAEALATGQTIVTPSALLDPRFRTRDSVRRAGIEAVLCAPIGEDPPRGVLYLQGPSSDTDHAEDDRRLAELFCRNLAPLVDRLVASTRQRAAADPTRSVRQQLRLQGVVGRSAALAATLRQVLAAAPLDVTVLLTGDSGTGKTQLARVIHENGPRAGRTFLELNCAALPEQLLESELFGALPGAHSAATKRMVGKVEAAAGGTLLLDEVGDLPLAMQAKLLQFLHSKQFFPLGSTRPVRADVRIIGATNMDLERAVAERRFREDLFYRLQVLPIRVPSLAERADDILELAEHFLEAAALHHGLPRLVLSPAARRAVQTAAWPGNIRHLEHAIQAGLIRAAGEGASLVEPSHLFAAGTSSAAAIAERDLTFQERTRRFQARMLLEALQEHDWNVSEVARRLDLTRAHVYNLIKAFGIVREGSAS